MKKSYNATRAIFNALLDGRHISQMNAREFMVGDIRTIVSHLKPRFKDSHTLNSCWITTPVRGVRIKEYWLVKREEAA